MMSFLILFYVLKVKELVFQATWFAESILTALFILFIIRNHKKKIKTKPEKFLIYAACLGFMLTVILTYTPFVEKIGLSPLPFINFVIMVTTVATYIFTADMIKVGFFKKCRST